MRSIQSAVVLLSVVLSSTALAWEGQLIFGLSELSCRITTLVDTVSRSPSSRGECERDSDCHSSYVCNNARQCVPHNNAAAAPSLRRRASELYLRERVVELREELALGRGPVINGLANAEGLQAKTLGKTLREHRAELVALIGDGSATDWSSKFLSRVDQLSTQS